MKTREMEAVALSDQNNSRLRGMLPSIRRIAADGPDGSEFDSRLIQFVFNVVTGDLLLASAQADQAEGA